jgi:PKD repeat protein
MQTWRSAVPLVAARTTSGRVNWFVLGLIAFALAPLVGCGSPGEPPSGGSRTPPSVVFFTAAPATVQPGSASTLAWSVTGADTLSIDHGVGTVIGTSTTVAPSITTTYTLTAANAAGSATAMVTVTVMPLPVITSFTAAPATVQPGSASTLAWSVTGADTLSIDHGVGTVIGRPDSR